MTGANDCTWSLSTTLSALGAYLLHYLHLEPISTLCILSLLTRNQLYAESSPPRLRRLLVDEIQVGCGENDTNKNKNKSEQVKKMSRYGSRWITVSTLTTLGAYWSLCILDIVSSKVGTSSEQAKLHAPPHLKLHATPHLKLHATPQLHATPHLKLHLTWS
jgi:hypothetical protein